MQYDSKGNVTLVDHSLLGDTSIGATDDDSMTRCVVDDDAVVRGAAVADELSRVLPHPITDDR